LPQNNLQHSESVNLIVHETKSAAHQCSNKRAILYARFFCLNAFE